FGDYDANGIAEIKMLDNAPRDKSFTVNYNDKAYTVMVKSSTATLTMGAPGGNMLSNPSPAIKQTVVSNQPVAQSIFTLFLKLIIMQNLLLY
ncbi:MAG: hypothetical protein ACREA1_05950, partial [Nitrosotalea sp.]